MSSVAVSNVGKWGACFSAHTFVSQSFAREVGSYDVQKEQYDVQVCSDPFLAVCEDF